MKRVIGTILLVIYAIVAITVTVLLLSYNEYNCSVIGEYTVCIVTDDSLEPEYKAGSILLIKHTSDKNLQEGDEMFIYKVINSQEYELVYKTLESKSQQGRHITYVTTDGENYASDYFIGKASDTIVINGWGYLLSILESRWGYLFCVVIVSLLLFLQEVFELVMELKYGEGSKKKQSQKVAQATVQNAAQVSISEAEPQTVQEENIQRPASTSKKPRATSTKTTATKTAKPKTTTTKATKTNTSATKNAKTKSTTAKTTSTKTTSTKTSKRVNNSNKEKEE